MNINDFKYAEYCGTDVIYQPTINWSSKQVARFFSKFDFLYVAKAICELAKNLLNENNNLYRTTPYGNDTLCKAFYLAIKYANNSINVKDKIPSEKDLEIILRIAGGEIDKKFNFISSTTNQICEDYTNQIARTWCIFHELWPQIYNDSPLQKIEEMVQVPYIIILSFSWSIVATGYTLVCREYKEFEEMGIKIDKNWCEKYLDFFSCSRNQWLSNSCPPVYISKPILDSGIIPHGKNSRIFFAPSAKNLISKVTTGLFYDLASQYNQKEGHGNTFKSQFGIVFEQYVIKLFKFHLGRTFKISGEIEYGTKHKPQGTTDLLIRQGDSLLLIEVKQASLYAKAYYEGNELDIKENLKRNLGKAVIQLAKTEKALKEPHHELQEFQGCHKIFRLIVINSPLYFANSFCKENLKGEVDLTDVAIINIYELELLLDVQQSSQNIFEILEAKQNGYSEYSFKNFLARVFPNAKQTGKFIIKYLNEVLAPINGSKK